MLVLLFMEFCILQSLSCANRVMLQKELKIKLCCDTHEKLSLCYLPEKRCRIWRPTHAVCALPHRQMPTCHLLKIFWYYEKSSNKCIKFHGPCRITGNMFETEDKCNKICVENVCNLSHKIGPICHKKVESWYYDKESNTCNMFDGTCDVKGNMFKTQDACEDTCFENVCDMAVPSNFTACHFKRSRWYYDKSLDTCVKFKGPCTVKGNMFMSRKLCEDNCIKRGDMNICDLPKVTGQCSGKLRRFFFDVRRRRCKKFVYGGCGGNKNNFRSRRECRQCCKKRVCTLPKPDPVCHILFDFWYYNVTSMTCDKVKAGPGLCSYGKNIFKTKQRCKKICDGVKSLNNTTIKTK